MTSHHHVNPQFRHSPPHMRKVAIKAARSAPHSKNLLTPKITIKTTKATKKTSEEVFVDKDKVKDKDEDEEDDDMESSFLQFCAMCEKQIVVPNSSILYCSESCRQRDAFSNPSLLTLDSPPNKSMMDDPFGTKIPTYVPALRPTPRTPPDGRIPAKFHEGKSDIDPTEWKPAEPSVTDGKSPTKCEWKPKLPGRQSSEASLFLGKFHRSSDSLLARRRPLVSRNSTTVSRTVPSLTHTPTASTSSTSSNESLAGTPYEFVASPGLSMSTTTYTDLDSSTSGMHGLDNKDITYEKKQIGVSLGSAAGSLKKLLGSAGDM